MKKSLVFLKEGLSTYSKTYLRQYQLERRISTEQLKQLQKPAELSKTQFEHYSQCHIPERVWQLILKFGYPVGALLIEDFDWELVCLLTGRRNVVEIIVGLDKQVNLQDYLDPYERKALRLTVTAYQSFLGRGAQLLNSGDEDTKLRNVWQNSKN